MEALKTNAKISDFYLGITREPPEGFTAGFSIIALVAVETSNGKNLVRFG